MAKNKRYYEDDDGRTVADMSDVERRPLLIPRLPKKEGPPPEAAQEADDERPWENHSMNKEERRAFISGALGATLLVGSVFAVVIGIAIFLISRMG